MNYEEKENTIILKNIKDFDIEEILECGQCFRFEKLEDRHYCIIAKGKALYIKQNNDTVKLYPCTKSEFENIWYNYFDLSRDYSEIKKIVADDDIMKKATEYARGIRILNQEPFECLLSFIISQNNNIPRIKSIIQRMSEKYGSKCNEGYLFPTPDELYCADVNSLFELRMGFRAKYIYDALEKLKSNEVNLYNTEGMTTDEILNMLIKIKGVGQKVADCTMLFSMNRREVFPTDVWVKRVMEQLYFNREDTHIKTIQAFAKEKWKNYAGYAQQYLFYYARSLKIGVK